MSAVESKSVTSSREEFSFPGKCQKYLAGNTKTAFSLIHSYLLSANFLVLPVTAAVSTRALLVIPEPRSTKMCHFSTPEDCLEQTEGDSPPMQSCFLLQSLL